MRWILDQIMWWIWIVTEMLAVDGHYWFTFVVKCVLFCFFLKGLHWFLFLKSADLAVLLRWQELRWFRRKLQAAVSKRRWYSWEDPRGGGWFGSGENDRISTGWRENKEHDGNRVTRVCVFLVTLQPASVWPLTLRRRHPGTGADGWLAGVSAPLRSTSGTICPFVSITETRTRCGE